jgi:tripartite ATP-independent transporter DctP family solute receptor
LKTHITIRSTIAATALAAVLQAIAAGPASAQTVLKFAWQLPLTNYASKGAERVAQCIQQKSGGSIKVETYPAGQLYRARQLYEAARTGAIDMAMFALGSFSTTDPMSDIVYLPFVVASQDRMFQTLHGDLGKFFDGIAGKANLRVLAYFAGSGGQFGSKGRALRKPEDFNGLKIRVPGAVAAEVVKTFGGVPTTVDASEVYLALQRGTVDGTNFPLTSFYDRKLYETIDRLTLANVSFDPDAVVIGQKAWSGLSPAGRDAVKACAAEGEDWVRAEQRRLSAEYVGLLREKGMQVIELTPEERRSWADAASRIVQEFVNKHGDQAKTLIAQMRAANL